MTAALSPSRRAVLERGLAALPPAVRCLKTGTRNGEDLDTDEAAVWKRVLAYRLAVWLQPRRVLETHAGLGVGTATYRAACPRAEIVSCTRWERDVPRTTGQFALIDVDPFGLPYTALDAVAGKLARGGVLCVTNGESLLVARNMQRSLYAPTRHTGKALGTWVTDEYLPRLERLTGLPVRFYYAFPSSIRALCAARAIPPVVTAGCPRFMWWLRGAADALL